MNTMYSMDKVKQIVGALNQASLMRIIILIIIAIVIIGILAYITSKLSLRSRKCSSLSSLYKNFPTISSFSPTDSNYDYTLKDYYIKTAHNACAIGDFKNSFVDLCALKEVIRQGYRCLDFEIYSVDNEPVVSTSSIKSYDVKQTYNSIPFTSICDVIANYAFSGSACPNPNDPVIVHLRIMSENTVIYKKIASSIYEKLENRVLGKKYSYENNGRNLGDVKLKDLTQKVIFAIDKSNPTFEGTDLDEYVNIASNSIFMQALRFNEVRYAPDMQELIEYNKKQMTIVLPDLSAYDSNYSSSLAMKYGCQMVAMNAQNYDSNLEFYDKLFDQAGSAFVLKPSNLRYIPVTINMPAPPPESYSYKSRDVSTDYYNFKV